MVPGMMPCLRNSNQAIGGNVLRRNFLRSMVGLLLAPLVGLRSGSFSGRYLSRNFLLSFNISSLAGKSASRFLGAYPASKFAVTAYTQQLRLELEPQGLHVLLVCPGPIAREAPRRHALEKSGAAEALPAEGDPEAVVGERQDDSAVSDYDRQPEPRHDGMFSRAHKMVWQNIIAVANGGRPENIVNGV